LFIKGNHDIAGPGAAEAFNRVLLPFLGEQAGQDLSSASFTVERAGALFAFLDAYDPHCLEWLEQTLARRSARHLFVVVHPPVVPFGARSLWHLYASPNQQPQRRRLLNVLGEHRAIVVCGHLHKFGVVVRETERGPFLQLALSSIIPRGDVAATQPRVGVAAYGPDLVELEPRFSPDTATARREALRLEAPAIRSYEYADAPGYALIEVRGGRDWDGGPGRRSTCRRCWPELRRTTAHPRFLPLRRRSGRDITRPANPACDGVARSGRP
jgi:hypothetical protein